MYSQQITLNNTSNIYSHDELPREQQFQDQRSLGKKIAHAVLAPLRDLNAVLKTIPSRILTKFNLSSYSEYCHPENPESLKSWNENSTGLHLFTHGFLGHPSIWNTYLNALRKEEANADVRAPFVIKEGNCSLEEATLPIREMLKNYVNSQIQTKENTIIPICLYGVSNGARITLNLLDGLIDEELDEKLKSKGLRLAIKVDLMAGVLRGTTYWKIRFANSCYLSKWIARNIFRISPEVLQDFKYKSESTTKLLDTVRKINNTLNINIQYNMFSTTEDGLVKPYTSALPVLGKGETHNIVHGEGHTSIVERVFSTVKKANAEWKISQEKQWNEHLQEINECSFKAKAPELTLV